MLHHRSRKFELRMEARRSVLGVGLLRWLAIGNPKNESCCRPATRECHTNPTTLMYDTTGKGTCDMVNIPAPYHIHRHHVACQNRKSFTFYPLLLYFVFPTATSLHQISLWLQTYWYRIYHKRNHQNARYVTSWSCVRGSRAHPR